MATWNSRGLRGSTFEDLINSTNEYYRKQNLGLVQKIPTPITPLKFNSEKKLITEAYFEKDSTVDYIGVVQEIPVCFDAKECKTDIFPIMNIHKHQVEFMNDWEKQGYGGCLRWWQKQVEAAWRFHLKKRKWILVSY